MEPTGDIKAVKDIIQNVIKAKKTLRMYPQNNPIYVKTLEDSYARFSNFLEHYDELPLKISQHSISYDSEQIYYNPDKDDNLALYFFKDGLREITFKKGLLQEELEEFLKIIALDFEREVVDDDIVTLLWEKDFQNIQYIVDEAFLVDVDEEDYETRAVDSLKDKISDTDKLIMEAYVEVTEEEGVKDVPIIPLTDKDLQTFLKEMEKDSADKTEKLATILFEILYQAEGVSDLLEDALVFLKETISYSMKRGDLHAVLAIMKEAKEMAESSQSMEETKKYMKMVLLYPGTEDVINLLGEILDIGAEIDEKVFREFIELLDKNAILPLVKILGELKTIHVRKKIIEALIILGRKDIKTLARGLDDQRWYVVRNIIYILRNIGDKGAIEYFLKTIRHGDVRVRKEVIKALGELGGHGVFQALRESLDDPDVQVRVASARAISNIGSEAAKKVILEKISDRVFKEKDFEEKKEFFEVLSRWKDEEVIDFLVSILKKRSFFGRTKNYENKACAAFSLGLLGNKETLPLLYNYRHSNNKLLKEFSNAAIKRIEHG